MAGLVSSVGLVVMLKALMHAHGQRAVFLGMMVLVTVIAADSPVAGVSLLSPTDRPSNEEPSKCDTLVFRGTDESLLDSLFESPDSPASDLIAEEPHPLSSPSLSPSEPVSGSSPQFESPAKLSSDWKLASTKSAKQSSSLAQPQSNISTASLSPSALTRSTPPQLGLNSKQKETFSKQQDGPSEQTLEIMTSFPAQPLEPLKLAFPDFVADDSKILDVNQLSPSSSPLEESGPKRDINTLPNPDEVLAPGYNVPFIAPHLASPSSEPTEISPEEFYPTNTMDFDWGSGDYLETISYLNADGEDYALVTKVPADSYDLEDYTESYDTSFPSRVGIFPSSLNPLHISPSSSFTTAYHTIVPFKSIHPSSSSSTIQDTLDPTPSANSDIPDASDVDWGDTFTIQPTDVLLPDMNSLEYYTTQLTKENSSDAGAEHKGNVTVVSISPTELTPTSSITNDTKLTEDESSGDLSGFEPQNDSTPAPTTEQSPQLVNASEPFLDPSITPSHYFDPSSVWGGETTTVWPAQSPTVGLTESMLPSTTPLLPDDVMSPSSLTDVHWFVTEPYPSETINTSFVLTATIAFSPVPTDPAANTTEVLLGDQGVTENGVDITATMTLIPTSSEANTVSAAPTTPTATITSHQASTGDPATKEASTSVNIPSVTTKAPTTKPTSRQYLCNLERPAYLVKIGFPFGATVGYAKSQVRDILKGEFNKSVELQVVDPPPKFVFRVVSGPVVYTAISVINALRRSGRRFLSVSPNWATPDSKYQVHTVLQFVPAPIDVRYCNFSESIEKGLTMAFAEMRRRSKESTNFTVHIINITMAAPKNQEQRLVRQPVDITFTVRVSRGYLMGSEVSNALMKLTMVEFSYYMGFPVLQIAEPFHYPELNTSHLLRSTWVKTVLIGVLDQKVSERTFQANMERRVAMLLGEATGLIRRVKRATLIGNSSVQVVSASRLVGADHPLEIVYFVEGPSGERMPADQTAALLNSLDVQRAAIVLGYRVQGILAQPMEKVASSPSDAENTNTWIVIGVVIPLLVVIVIISILYWKLCRTDKLEFQPDAMTSIQQRQKLQAPSVKGFDFAKLHLGQQSKDDVMVIQEAVQPGPGPGPLPLCFKDGFSPSENGEIPTPLSKASTKASRSSRRRDRISPSDGDSVVSDHSSERESTEENLRAHATPSDRKQTHKLPINVLNDLRPDLQQLCLCCLFVSVLDSCLTIHHCLLSCPSQCPPPMNGTNEQLSSAAIFEHVDRMSRAADASRRLPNKIQLIAMQPMALPPLHSPPINGKLSDPNQINKEIQVALRHKSEIEHHRNKIRLRAKRKGHYDFPTMDESTNGHGDAKDQDRIYQKAQTQIDKILDPDAQTPSFFMDSKRSGRGRRSPKQRMKEQLIGMMEADKDHLISEDNDAVYRKCPGVNNVAYVTPLTVRKCVCCSRTLTKAQAPLTAAPPPPMTCSSALLARHRAMPLPRPPYMPPQPSIEEARQQMHSLLDDAFALVSPTSQGSTAGITLPGVNSNPPLSSPPGRGPRPWGPSYQAHGPFPGRFTDLSPPPIQGLISRQGLGSSFLPPGETAGQREPLPPDSLYSSRGLYAAELPSSARPRPVGLSSRMNGYPAGVRPAPGQNGGLGWNHHHGDNYSRAEPEKDSTPRGGIREPSAPPAHLDISGMGYLSAPLDTSPPNHSSASLIKAIREELLRLSQKQAATPSYHS
ncbi:UPF0606 protein KIAA1549 [Dissostichus eleginoides]|uniref:UPF0606 protein KIAA1549 n=1 Tax=Dissostichus eleginoides TaxID=100907 RepID=A0AAD9F3L6_DISEL|nr:UPF0606 protein KIAA1549 [Dissostichus eleginoides]